MPPTGAWQLERISRQAFDRVAIAIDDVGALHVAGSGRRGIVYLTNAGGEWTSVSLGVPSGTERYDRIASLAIDYLGRIAVAIERRDCPVPGCMATAGEVYAAVVDPSGGWSTMMRVGEGLEPSILLHEGDVHLAYVGGAYSDDVCSEKRPVRYATNEQGTWVDVRATRDGHDGLIALERDGDPVVIAGNLCETLGPEGAFLVRPTGEPLGRLDPVPGTTPDDELVNVAVDLVDHVHLLYRRDGANHYVRRDDVEWTQPIELPDGTAGAIGTAGDGVAHIVGFDGTRVWHASNTTGTFVADLISPAPASDHYLFRAAVNVADRPHVVFVMPDADGNPDELWHAVMVPD